MERLNESQVSCWASPLAEPLLIIKDGPQGISMQFRECVGFLGHVF